MFWQCRGYLLKNVIIRALKRLNLQSFVLSIPIFGNALYEGLSAEFVRVDDYKNIIKNSVVPNVNMDESTLSDYEKKYGLSYDSLLTADERRAKIIERASQNGNGTATWLQQQIRQAGFDLYVIENFKDTSTGAQFGDFQFGTEQYGGLVTYKDPRYIPGEVIASSPSCNMGGQFISFGDFQFGDGTQFGTLQSDTSYPVPCDFVVPATPDYWGYVFFISPFEDRLAESTELQSISTSELKSLKKLIIQLKHVRNWAIVQVTTGTLQKEITSDGMYKTTTDGLINNVLSDLT